MHIITVIQKLYQIIPFGKIGRFCIVLGVSISISKILIAGTAVFEICSN